MHRLIRSGCVLALATVAQPAFAGETAEELFDRGVKAFLGGRHAEGCPLLERSYALDPLPGVAFTLAECHRGWGRLKSAAASYDRFLKQLAQLPPGEAKKHEERRQVASKRLAETRARIPKLSVTVRGGLAEDGRVTLDGEDISDAIGEPLPVDPGDHVVQLHVDDEVREERKVSLTPGGSARIELAAPAFQAAVNPLQDSPTQQDPARPIPTGVWVLGGVGVAGIAVGSVTGLMAAGKKQDIEDNCPNRVCNEQGRSSVDSAQSLGFVSTLSFGIGAAALGGAAFIWLSDSGTEAEAAKWQSQVRGVPGGATMSFSGRF